MNPDQNKKVQFSIVWVLIAMLVVIAIFGVLAAVVIGPFQHLYTAIKNRGKK